MERRDVIVIGAGPGGLAAAATLRAQGLQPLVLERAPHVGARWRGYYDGLTLQSPNWLTDLPGMRIPRRLGTWVDRDGFVEYLELYAARRKLDVATGVTVGRIDRHGDGWSVTSSTGTWHAPHVVVATGYNNVPYLPAWPGRDGFRGELLHASAFRNGKPYRDQDVLVVGAGNTGAEIAHRVSAAGAARVRLSIRTPPHVAPVKLLGVPSLLTAVLVRRLPTKVGDILLGGLARAVVGDLSRHGIQKPPEGLYTQYKLTLVTPVLDTGFVGAVRRGDVEVVTAVKGFDGDDVVLADGERINPQVVIAATGYRRGLEPLVGHLEVLGPDGTPLHHGAACAPHAPGLHFIGYTHPISGNIREIGIDARKIARVVAAARAAR